MSLSRVPRSCYRLFLISALSTILLLPAGCSKGEKSESAKSKTEKTGNGTTPGGSAGSKDLQAQVYAALDRAVKLLEDGKYAEFIESFMPVEQLRQVHRMGGPSVAARLVFSKPETKKFFIEMLKRMRKEKPRFIAARSVAVFEVVDPGKVVKADNVPLLKDGDKSVKITGYGGDLKGAIIKAITDLEKGEVEAYLRNMLPVVELQLNDVKVLAKRIDAAKPTPRKGGDGEAAIGDGPVEKSKASSKKSDDAKKKAAQPTVANPLVAKMIADLKAVAKAKPKMESDGNVAVFEIPFVDPTPAGARASSGRFGGFGSRSNGSDDKAAKKNSPKQVIKFQKDGGNWRLFDNTTPLRKAAKGMSRKIAASSEKAYMEKIGNQWRLAEEVPENDYRGFGFGKTKTVHRSYREKTGGYDRYEKTEDPGVKRDDEKTKAEGPNDAPPSLKSPGNSKPDGKFIPPKKGAGKNEPVFPPPSTSPKTKGDTKTTSNS